MAIKIETDLKQWAKAYIVFASLYVSIITVAILYGPLAVSEGCARLGLFHVAVIISPTIHLQMRPFIYLFPLSAVVLSGTLFLFSYLPYDVMGYSSSESIGMTLIFTALLTTFVTSVVTITAARKIDKRIKSVLY